MFLADAEHVDIMGLSLFGITAHYGSFLLDTAQAGCKFRFILTDPESSAVISASGFLTEGVNSRKQDIELSSKILALLIESGNAELKYTSVALPFSILILDPDKLDGQIIVELYAYRVSSTERPHFVITESLDKHWYDFSEINLSSFGVRAKAKISR